MKKIIITSESGCDLTKEQLNQYGIQIIPFGLNFPDRTVQDGEIPVQEIYDFYKRTKQIPKTNAVGPYQYTEFFENIAKENPDCEIVHVGYSSACSSTFQNACLGVRDCVKAKVHLVDSKNVSGGLGNLVLRAARMVEANPDQAVEELVEKIKNYVTRTKTAFVPDKLDFLSAGGRVSNAAALGASIFRIKPQIDIINGELIAGKKYLGMMKKVAKEFIQDFLGKEEFDKETAFAFYSVGVQMDVLGNMVAALKDYGFKEVIVLELGCVMTTHGGKGAIGVSATRKN
ncbi:DegV family protein [Beduini massiliensis]|uniref:DegV family protein n=1 Tax=Beduini massiliensis TaxID=1585974 RepID=UPI00059A91DC|nr:DegV family protein [Beduini massiliensis]